jgi:hypothetical protein
VLDDATYNGDATNGATVSGATLSWSGPVAVGGTVTITYSVTINNPLTGNKTLLNVVDPTGPGGDCATEEGCTTVTTVTAPPPAKVTPAAGPLVGTGGTVIQPALWPITAAGGFAAAGIALMALLALRGRKQELGLGD